MKDLITTRSFFKAVIIALVVLYTLKGNAQDEKIAAMMTRHVLTCIDINYNSRLLIPEYYEKGNLDTVNAIIRFWEKKCGLYEAQLRLKILLAIEKDSLRETLYKDVPVISYITEYRDNQKALNYYSHRTFNPYWEIPENNALDTFSRKLAGKLQRRTDLSSLDRFFVDLYSDRSENILKRLYSDSSLAKTHLKESYDSIVKPYVKMYDHNWALYSGVWMPIGNLQVVGDHMLLGMKLGIKKNRFDLNGCADVRFGSSQKAYQVMKNDSLYATKHFTGWYLGAEGGVDLVTRKQFTLSFSIDAAYDGIEVLALDQKNSGNNNYNNNITKTVESFNFNAGLEFRKLFKGGTYLGFEPRFNFLNYMNEKGTDFTGNALTIRVSYGWCGNYFKHYSLKRYDLEDQ